ncbi:hypothetical protein HN695_00940 [Candidatus Woesearchaeota archaeon]|jgi:hypothetical protein|nr:hypothetical protein [Candidatus Woesearchaeota archaeon]MBT5272761.1 hypothetical protein [Candidatus Woesearchaeota archaeon]MBT6040373.1 hypothetical protein [Candidatus Woesearchaeota archaeon]MBT6336994.1 hypothetical protein [Candidatus Woesearchaeota archaeon]MBT7926880.1 hypothetical protein [Candidatus Woesearchaeota archaeon]
MLVRKLIPTKLSSRLAIIVALATFGCTTFNPCKPGQYKLPAGCYKAECQVDTDCAGKDVYGGLCGDYGRCVDCLTDRDCSPGDKCELGACMNVLEEDFRSYGARTSTHRD